MHLLHRGSFMYGYKTQTANTVITQLIPPKRKAKTRVTQLTYRSGTTAHALSLLKPLASTTLTAAAEADQAVLNIADSSPSDLITSLNETIAANDYLVWETAAGGYEFGLVSSISTLAVTLTANIAAAAASGAKVWIMYEVARTTAGSGQMVFQPAASTTRTFSDPIAGIMETDRNYEPVLFHSGNATAAGFLESLSGYYAR